MKAIIAEKRKSDIAGPMSKERIYLTFALNNREYGIELLKISKIVGITTPVPMVHRFIKAEYFFPKGILFSPPYYVKGIIRLHEKIVPIDDEIFIGMVTTNDKKKVLLNIDKVLGTTLIAYKLNDFEYV